MTFGLGTALGPLIAGTLVRFGFVVPFAFGAALAVIGFLLIYTQIEETLNSAQDETDQPIEAPDTTPASTD